MKLIAIFLVSAAVLLAQDAGNKGRKPSPVALQAQPGNGSERPAAEFGSDTAADPYAEDLRKAQDAEREWKRLDMSLNARLEAVGVCSSDPGNLINTTSAARVQSLSAFNAYFTKHQSRWRDAMNSALATASDRARIAPKSSAPSARSAAKRPTWSAASTISPPPLPVRTPPRPARPRPTSPP